MVYISAPPDVCKTVRALKDKGSTCAWRELAGGASDGLFAIRFTSNKLYIVEASS